MPVMAFAGQAIWQRAQEPHFSSTGGRSGVRGSSTKTVARRTILPYSPVNEERGFADIAEIGFRCGGFMGERAGEGIVYGRLACRDHERPMSLPFQFERGKERKLVKGEVYRTVMVKILIGGGFFAVHLFHDGVE